MITKRYYLNVWIWTVLTAPFVYLLILYRIYLVRLELLDGLKIYLYSVLVAAVLGLPTLALVSFVYRALLKASKRPRSIKVVCAAASVSGWVFTGIVFYVKEVSYFEDTRNIIFCFSVSAVLYSLSFSVLGVKSK